MSSPAYRDRCQQADQGDAECRDFIDAASAEPVLFSAQLAAVTDLVAEDAEALGCAAPLDRAREIATAGTSADRQRAVFADVQAGAGDPAAGLRAVVDWIAATTG